LQRADRELRQIGDTPVWGAVAGDIRYLYSERRTVKARNIAPADAEHALSAFRVALRLTGRQMLLVCLITFARSRAQVRQWLACKA
jgi:hypothetical protein